ncbi:hypothetical protein [Euzebya sp.]|uniref:hypothetical protein n=1 Tax=Euzebya sp. TaxID=1971409 RepID=UPI003511B9AB
MERTRIDRRDLGLRARRLALRARADDAAAAPLRYTAGGGADVDDDVVDRIDAVLDEVATGQPHGDHDTT